MLLTLSSLFDPHLLCNTRKSNRKFMPWNSHGYFNLAHLTMFFWGNFLLLKLNLSIVKKRENFQFLNTYIISENVCLFCFNFSLLSFCHFQWKFQWISPRGWPDHQNRFFQTFILPIFFSKAIFFNQNELKFARLR